MTENGISQTTLATAVLACLCFFATIAGEGWVRSRLLKSGMRIHDVTGTTEVRAVVDEGSLEPTYNLIVADFHTYFVGQARVLSHDHSIRKPTAAIVPGLVAP